MSGCEIAADGEEPAIASCPNTYNCTRGIEFWGKDNAEPQHNLDLFVLDVLPHKSPEGFSEDGGAAHGPR